MKHPRKRMLQAFYLIMVMILGLASRKYGELLPRWLAVYSGDILWGLMVYLMVGFLLPKQKIIHTAFIAAAFSALMEMSQLYHTPWIDAIRSNKLGGLLLGYGFLWSDLICYALGIAFGVIIEWVYYTKTTAKEVQN
jgi:hypothetical protein